MSLSIVLPAYMEADNLQSLIPTIHKELEQYKEPYEIVVVDTCEPLDHTQEICDAFNAKYVPRSPGNTYGDAIRTGFKTAVYEYIVIMDADGSHNPKDILKLLDAQEKGKPCLVIGSRYAKGGSTDNNAILRFMSFLVNIAYRILFNIPIYDVSDSFRVYQSSTIKSIELKSDNFDLVEEILLVLRINNPDIVFKEVPIHFSKRQYGESKRALIKFVLSYFNSIVFLKKIQKEHSRSCVST